MNTDSEIRDDARAGRFGRRFCYYDAPVVVERLERTARELGCSAAAIARTAVRSWLETHDDAGLEDHDDAGARP